MMQAHTDMAPLPPLLLMLLDIGVHERSVLSHLLGGDAG